MSWEEANKKGDHVTGGEEKDLKITRSPKYTSQFIKSYNNQKVPVSFKNIKFVNSTKQSNLILTFSDQISILRLNPSHRKFDQGDFGCLMYKVGSLMRGGDPISSNLVIGTSGNVR